MPPNNNYRHPKPQPLRVTVRCSECSTIMLLPYTCPICQAQFCDECLESHISLDPSNCRAQFRRTIGRKEPPPVR